MPQEFLPLLKPENIDELKSLILEIMEDNDSKLEKIIQNRQTQAAEQGQQFSIEDLNDLLSQQCLQKQKIVSNLSHFALSLMNTIQVLWQDNQDLEYRIRDQRDVMEQMNNHLHEISKQGDFLKNKLNVAYSDMHKIEEEKIAIEQYLSSIIVKHDSSFCLKQSRKVGQNNSDIEMPQSPTNQQNYMLFNGAEPIMNELNLQDPIQQTQQPQDHEQNSMSLFQKQHRGTANRHQYQMNLLEESVIKDSISVLRRFTLEDEIEKRLPILEESEEQNIRFLDKSHRFSLINQISLQIFQQPKHQKNHQQTLPQQSFVKDLSQERSTVRDLRIFNEKVNVTIATGTEFTRTKDSEKNHHQQFSMIQPSPSCTSFLLQRQNSAVMYPSLQRSNSTMSFVTHTTKMIQTDPPKLRDTKKKDIKNIERTSIGVDASTFIEKNIANKKQSQKASAFTKQKNDINLSNSQKSEENSSRKSFGQLLDYFTKKIVSDRIKTANKKNDLGGFKKTKSNIQKVF